MWWAAELTRSDGSGEHEHTRALASLLSSQYRTERLLSMAVLRHSAAMLGVLDVLGDDTRWQVVSEICRRLGVLATTYAVMAMTRAEVRRLVSAVYAEVVGGGGFSDAGEPPKPAREQDAP